MYHLLWTCIPMFPDIDVDECLSNPCQNGGSCLDGNNSYTCVCNDTIYRGVHCEKGIDSLENFELVSDCSCCFFLHKFTSETNYCMALQF